MNSLSPAAYECSPFEFDGFFREAASMRNFRRGVYRGFTVYPRIDVDRKGEFFFFGWFTGGSWVGRDWIGKGNGFFPVVGVLYFVKGDVLMFRMSKGREFKPLRAKKVRVKKC